MKRLFLLLPLLSLSLVLLSQTQRQVEKAAANAFSAGSFAEAYEYYTLLMEYDSNLVDANYNLGVAANNLFAYPLAEMKLLEVRQSDEKANFPYVDYWLGVATQHQGKYEEAKSYYETFLYSSSSLEPSFLDKARKGMDNADWALTQVDSEELHEINLMGDEVNSPFSDFNAITVNDKVYFSSLRYEMEDDKEDPPRKIAKVLQYDSDNGSVLVDMPFNEENQMHTNNVALDSTLR